MILLIIGACKDSDNDDPETDRMVVVSFGTPLLKTFENITPVQIPVVLSHVTTQDVKVFVDIKSEEGAKEGTHYRLYLKEITIPKGATAGYFEIELIDDREINPDRIFTVELLEAVGTRVSETVSTCRVIIQSDEGFPTLELRKNTTSIGEDEGILSIPVGLNRKYTKPVSFKIRAINGTAEDNVHFRIPDPQGVIAAGDTISNVQIEIIDDIDVNSDRVFEIELYDGNSTVISEVYARCKVTIINDDKDAYVSFGTVKTELFESDGSLIIPVKLDGMPKKTVTVKIVTRESSAEEGVHYTFEEKEIVFPVGVKQKNIKVNLIDDAEINYDRDLTIGFAEIDGALTASQDTLCRVTVLNDDLDYNLLYDELLGTTWTMVITPTTNLATTCTVTFSGGSTLEEQDANYRKFFICKAEKFGGGSYDLTFRMNYNPQNGEMAIVCGDMVAKNVGFNPVSNVKFDHGSATNITPSPVVLGKGARTISFTGVNIQGGIYHLDTHPTSPGQRWGYWFALQNGVMTRKLNN